MLPTVNITYSDRKRMETGLFVPRVARYATPNRVYGSMDSTTMLTAPVNAITAALPTPAV